jgi:transcriptional regulator with XRE-family HTH domain
MTTRERGPAVARRQLRLTLRKARALADKTQAEVADALDWSPSKIMRIENGQVAVQTSDLMALGTQYPSLTREQMNELKDLARIARSPNVASRYEDVLTREFKEWLEYEAFARSIRQYETLFVPGVLQTDEYATGIVIGLMGVGRTVRRAERIVQARLERAESLVGPDGPAMSFIVDQAALVRAVGNEDGSRGVQTMIDQLTYLKKMNTRGRAALNETIEDDLNPDISLQVVPFSIGAYQALRGPFEIAEFEEESLDSMLYFENPEGDQVIRDNPETLQNYSDLFATIKKRIPGPEETGRILDSIIEQLRGQDA